MKLAPSKSAAPAHILDAQTTAVISLDSALRVVFINSTAESVFGVSRRYAIGELFTHACPSSSPTPNGCAKRYAPAPASSSANCSCARAATRRSPSTAR